jgi:hypothetical protein
MMLESLRGRVNLRWANLRWLGAGVLMGAITFALVAAPASQAAEVEYSKSFTAECVVSPGVLNFKTTAKITVSSLGPSEVTPGQEGMFHGAHATITTPVALTEEFAVFGATEARGKSTNFVLDNTNAEPAKINIAKPAEFPEGLPFIAPVEKGKESVFNIPSLTKGETGKTYTFGPIKVTASSGVTKATVDPAAGFTETEPGVYKATGEGLVTTVAGFNEKGEQVISPAMTVCTAPAGLVVAEIPIHAASSLEAGHPELYSNNVRLTTSKLGTSGWGPIKLVSEVLGTEIECVNVGFGTANNEGTPAFGKGQILGWDASGDATTGGTEARRSCKFKKAGVEGEAEAWATDEPAVETVRKTPLSVPWNVELMCNEAEATKKPLVRIGIPNGAAAPAAACKTEAERTTEIANEETERKGCYAEVVPEGCVKVDIIVPVLGLEQIFEGTQQPSAKNGFTSGLHPSAWEFVGTAVGKLHLKGVFATTGTTSGKILEVGFSALQLVTAK